MHTSISLSVQAEPLLKFFTEKAIDKFKNRIVSIFKLGSLGEHGDFSLCSDVDVGLMLDEIKEFDQANIQELNDEIKSSTLEYADRLSIFWSSYSMDTFPKGVGRFPPLDRLDLIRHAVLLHGADRRNELPVPTQKELIISSAEFISSFMLAGKKIEELTLYPEKIVEKGTRYFTKFVLFPIRLIFTLDNPGVISSNLAAIEHFNKTAWCVSRPEVAEISNFAYKLRSTPADKAVEISVDLLKKVLLPLYDYCMSRYHEALLDLNCFELANKLEIERKKLITKESA